MGFAFQGDVAAQLPRQVLRDGQAQAVALDFFASGIFHGEEAIEHGFGQGFVDAFAVVGDFHEDFPACLPDAQTQVFSGGAVADGVGDQVK